MAFLPARFCAEYPDFALTDCGNPRPGAGFGGIFGCPAAFRPRQTGRCGRIFSVFCGKAGGSVHRYLWTSGGVCGWLGEFVRPVFYAYPQDSGGRVFLLQCPDSRSAGVAYGYAYRAFQHSFPQAVKKRGKVHSLFHTVWKTGGVFDNGVVGSGVLPLASPATEPKRHWLSLPLGYPAGGVAVLVARLPFTLALFFPPSPRPPSQREGGDSKFSYARGFAPCIPRD